MSTKNKIRIIYLLILMGTLMWLALIFLAPYLRSESSPYAGFVYGIFSPTCHQIPSRCFESFGYPLSVCSRCLGIYAGFLAGLIVYPVLNGFEVCPLPRARIFILASIPIVLDTAGNLLSFWASPGWMRFSTGILWGIILPSYVLAGVSDLIKRCKFRLKSNGINQ